MTAQKKELIFLLIILAIAAFFRLWQLNSIPPGLYPDVAMNGNDALDSLRAGHFKVFYPENNGREGLMMWLIAISFSIFGVSIWSMKIVAAAIGILTVLGLYLLTREIFQNTPKQSLAIARDATGQAKYKRDTEYIALLSSFFLATSFWHTNFSRIGFRAILLPFILVFAFYFLFRGFRNQRVWNFIVAGVFFGLGFYTYTAYRFIVLLLPIILGCWFFIYRKEKLQKKYLLFTFYFLILTFIVALPLAIYFLQNPGDFIGRASQVSIFAQKNPVSALGKSIIYHLGMFNFYGDPNWRHNLSGYPMLPFFIGILFLAGFIISIKSLVKSLRSKNCFSFLVFCFLLGWFLIMLLPGFLTIEGIPHALRTLGTIPMVYILAGLGGYKLYEFLDNNTKRKRMLLAATFLFLAAATISEFTNYFFVWARLPEVKDAFTQRYADIGYYLNSLPPKTQKYVIVNESGAPLKGISIPAQTPMLIESTQFGSPQSIYLKAEELSKIKIGQQKTIIIPLYDGNILNELQKKFPQGKIKEIKGFKIYEANPVRNLP